MPNHFHSLYSLTGLDIFQCSCLKSFIEKGFPTNLTSLSVQDHNIYKELVEWGFHKLTSLTLFWVGGCLDAESFSQGRNGNAVALPASLIYLIIERFPKLKYRWFPKSYLSQSIADSRLPKSQIFSGEWPSILTFEIRY